MAPLFDGFSHALVCAELWLSEPRLGESYLLGSLLKETGFGFKAELAQESKMHLFLNKKMSFLCIGVDKGNLSFITDAYLNEWP